MEWEKKSLLLSELQFGLFFSWLADLNDRNVNREWWRTHTHTKWVKNHVNQNEVHYFCIGKIRSMQLYKMNVLKKNALKHRPSYVLSGANGCEISGDVPSVASNRLARRPCFELLCTNIWSDIAISGPSTDTCVAITTCNG